MNPIWLNFADERIVLGFPSLEDATAWVKNQSDVVGWLVQWTFRINDRGEGVATCGSPVAVDFEAQPSVVKGVEVLAEESIDRLLEDINQEARGAGQYEYGLPLHAGYKSSLHRIVREWFNRQ